MCSGSLVTSTPAIFLLRNTYNLSGKRNPEDDLETKPVLKKHKETSEEKEETTKGFADSLQHKSDQANLISVKEAAIRKKKTLCVGNLPLTTTISDILHFFKDAGEVVRVRTIPQVG
ncbi:PREDICTED: uncharacterized protein LOC109125170 [Camelina sativa]|uniref:Uncharacterized protein LOC109125170 n=1 Tax=Camelina sativa TaxID=90675 RepID=A0ABM1QJ53_CAMSA|nr:PREDICTED: uncharacterized protein LOC109125170 [Camelina sativa]